MNLEGKIVRWSPPHKLDSFERGTECIVMKKNNRCDIYIQRSLDENKPDWFLLEEDVEIDSNDDMAE